MGCKLDLTTFLNFMKGFWLNLLFPWKFETIEKLSQIFQNCNKIQSNETLQGCYRKIQRKNLEKSSANFYYIFNFFFLRTYYSLHLKDHNCKKLGHSHFSTRIYSVVKEDFSWFRAKIVCNFLSMNKVTFFSYI